MEPLSKPPELMSFAPDNNTASTKKSGTPVALILGVVVLIGLVGALVYLFVLNKNDGRGKLPGTSPVVNAGDTVKPPAPGTDKPGTPQPPPEVKPEAVKPPEPTPVPVKPAEPTEGVEVTTDPPGVNIDFGGKTYGPTPTHVPGLTVGSQIALSLRGYQEAKIRLRTQPEEGKPLFFKLTPIERLVEINSTPKGADLFLDGKKIGKTPFVIKKIDTTKPHQIEVRRPGFATWTHALVDSDAFVAKNRKEVLTLNATLEASEEGGKKAPHGGAKKEPAAGDATPPAGASPAPAAPAEAPKPADPAPEPAKEAPPAQ
jgi:hypothetical protein